MMFVRSAAYSLHTVKTRNNHILIAQHISERKETTRRTSKAYPTTRRCIRCELLTCQGVGFLIYRRSNKENVMQLQLSLFLADLLQAIGAAIDARWAHTGTVRIGPLCTAQGMLRLIYPPRS